MIVIFVCGKKRNIRVKVPPLSLFFFFCCLLHDSLHPPSPIHVIFLYWISFRAHSRKGTVPGAHTPSPGNCVSNDACWIEWVWV